MRHFQGIIYLNTNILIDFQICVPLSNIWASIHENVKQNWGWAEKTVTYKKSVYLIL